MRPDQKIFVNGYAANDLFDQGLITDVEKVAIMSVVGGSISGDKK